MRGEWLGMDDPKTQEAAMTSTIGTGIHLGERSPDWLLPRLDGGELGPAMLRGTPALIFFWGSW
jgi:hypothetical protein